jgi:hypothetical protein
MKRILFLILLLAFALPAHPQSQALTVTPPAFTSSLSIQATSINLIGTGVNLHKFSWYTTGTVSAGACALTAGSDNVTFGTTLIAAQTVTSSGGPTALTSGVFNYLKLNCTTPIVGTGSVTITYTGYIDPTSGSATISGALPAGTNIVGTVRTTPAQTGYTADYNSGLFVPKQTTDTVTV